MSVHAASVALTRKAAIHADLCGCSTRRDRRTVRRQLPLSTSTAPPRDPGLRGNRAWISTAAGDPIINAYDEDSEPAEELFIVINGRAMFTIEGEEVDATTGTLLFTAPGTHRTAIAAEPSTTILVVDGTPGKAYAASGWELWAPLRPLYDNGEYAELSTQLQDLIAEQPHYPMLVYNLACCESLSGRTVEALDHLRRAIGASEKFRGDARNDSDFDAIRHDPSFLALIDE
jgi:hypothetical protein